MGVHVPIDDTDGAVGGSPVVVRGGPDTPVVDRGCQHVKGGRCLTHGEGAKLKWKPGPKTTTIGPDGKTVTRSKRIYFYKCDLGLNGGGRLVQPKLSFMKTTPG